MPGLPEFPQGHGFEPPSLVDLALFASALAAAEPEDIARHEREHRAVLYSHLKRTPGIDRGLAIGALQSALRRVAWELLRHDSAQQASWPVAR